MNNLSKGVKIAASLVLILAFVSGSFYSGYLSGRAEQVDAANAVINKDSGKPKNVDFALFWKVWTTLDQKFVQTGTSTVDTSSQARMYGAIKGMVDAMGDPYTVFQTPEEAAEFNASIEGSLEGVGLEMGIKDKVLTVIAPLPNSPAQRAGIISGDKVVAINGKSTVDIKFEEAIKTIRGKKGTSVKLTVVREGKSQPIDFVVVRDVISIPALDTNYNKTNGVFTIRLYSFNAQSATEFQSALRAFIESKSDKLVLDLRGNPGGFLWTAVDIASYFLPQGKVVVKESIGSGKDKKEEIETSRGYNIFNQNLKMVVLVDGGSASASEILAGALQEHGVAKVVGNKTFGKGSVQEYIKTSNNTAIKVTIAKWLTPNGVSISEGGLTPDYVVNRTVEDIQKNRDPQMDKAVELLSRP